MRHQGRGLRHSRIILSDPQTFRTFTAVLSSIAAFNTPGALMCTSVLPHQRWPSGRKEALGGSVYPANQLHAGSPFSTLNPFALATALSPPGLIRQKRDGLSVPQELPGFLAGSPLAPAEYDYDAKRIAPTGLSPASTAASLAAPSLSWIPTSNTAPSDTDPIVSLAVGRPLRNVLATPHQEPARCDTKERSDAAIGQTYERKPL